MNREVLISELHSKSDMVWDIIIIGGGATGLGIALDAVSRGYKTLLLEKYDFAKGTSSRSTKLVHGGVRYLAKGDLLLVVEALHERGLILRNAPHLTFNQEFIIPVYSYWSVFLYTVGLKFYDILAGRLSMGKSHYINREKVINRFPHLKQEGLKGGVVYHDGQFDDARLAISIAKECADRGCLLLNYFPVIGLLKNDIGMINGVLAKDSTTGNKIKLFSRLVINATGVFADEIIRMDNPGSKSFIRPSQGVHIVVDRSFIESNTAIMIPKTDDGRVLFAIPWYDKVVIGTTDTPVDKINTEPVALNEEIEFILNTAQKYLTKKPKREDILCVFAGLRPLAANQNNSGSTKDISRRHKIILSIAGLLTITGGKWTTYRLMAKETIDKAIKSGILEKRKCNTSHLKLTSLIVNNTSERFRIYGDDAPEIEKIIMGNPEMGNQVHPAFPYSFAEIIWICRNEMPVTIDDILARRTRALFLDARASSEMAPAVAKLMADEMKLGEQWQKAQVEDYNKIVLNYL